MRKGNLIGRILWIALVLVMIEVVFPLGALPPENQALAQAPRTWYVDDDLQNYPDADFTKIGDALAAAAAGDTIIVYSGTFYENLTLNKKIFLKGIGYPVIDGRRSNVITITADSSSIQGFKLVNGGHHPSWPAAGIWVKSNNNVIESNIIEKNRFGIELSDSNYNVIKGNTIRSNDNDGISLGLSLSEGSHYNEISGNDIYSNGEYGVCLHDSSNNKIIGNNVFGNGYVYNGIGFYLANSPNNLIYLNNFADHPQYNVYPRFAAGSSWSSPETIAYTYGGKTYANYIGNYWDDYAGSDADGDGIGDTPYPIVGSDADNYPLVEPFENYEVGPIAPQEWSFAIITDLHIGWCNTDYGTEGWNHDSGGKDYWLTDRLNGIVQWINENEETYNIDFVVVLGDIADSGEYSEFLKAREALNNLKVPYIPIIGNHDIWPYTQQEETCECPVTNIRFHCEKLWRDLRVPSLWAPSAMGYEFFEEVFWRQNNQDVEKIETLFGASWRRQLEELGVPLENYVFTHNGVKFVALDFVDRLDDDPDKQPESSGAKVHSDTRTWLTAKLEQNEPTILLSHHPIWSPAYFPVVDATSIKTIISNSGADVLANFGGHIHDEDKITSSDNLAGIDSILTEAVCRESILWPLAQTGNNIRIVKIGKDEKIKGYEFGNIHDEDWDYPGGEFWAWSPVDLMITDPDGFVISKGVGPVSGMVYLEMDVNHDGDPEDIVVLDELKIGDYKIAVIPEPGASPTDTYTLEFSRFGSRMILAENVQIGDIPSNPYIVSIPGDSEPTPESGFANLIDEGKLVIAYNFDPFTTVPTAVNGWTWYDPTLPPAQNNLAKLHKNTAYWIKVTEECWLTYETKTYHLAAGWNNPVWLGC